MKKSKRKVKRLAMPDISDVRMEPVRVDKRELEAEVTTRYGTARRVMDLSSDDEVGLRITLPSRSVFTTSIDSWASDKVDHGNEEGRNSILRLAAAAVIQSFEKEAALKN
jgi:hypothetical protein